MADPEGEVGPPVRPEIELDDISNPRRADHPSLANLEAVDVVPVLGWVPDRSLLHI